MKPYKMFKCITLILIFLAPYLNHAQYFLINDFFYKPINDSILWESPLSPRLVIREGITEVRLSGKNWDCKRKPDCVCLSTNNYSCTYIYFTKIYQYDSLGYPIKIVIRKDSAFDRINVYDLNDFSGKFIMTKDTASSYRYEFKCINTYNKRAQLEKAELYRS